MGIKLYRTIYAGRAAITTVAPSPHPYNRKSLYLLSPGITDPLPGWDWLLNREHPLVELQMSIEGSGYRNTFRIDADNANSDKIVKEVCSVAVRR